MEAEPTPTLSEISVLQEVQRRMEPARLHHAGQQAQHTADRAIPTPIRKVLKTSTVYLKINFFFFFAATCFSLNRSELCFSDF